MNGLPRGFAPAPPPGIQPEVDLLNGREITSTPGTVSRKRSRITSTSIAATGSSAAEPSCIGPEAEVIDLSRGGLSCPASSSAGAPYPRGEDSVDLMIVENLL